MLLFTIYDKKAECYLNPVCARTLEEMLRQLRVTASNPDSPFSKFPEDFLLIQIATWDDNTGVIEPLDKPKIISDVSDIVVKDSPQG